jgi:hypothetical protein
LFGRLQREVTNEHGSSLFFLIPNFILRVFVTDLLERFN